MKKNSLFANRFLVAALALGVSVVALPAGATVSGSTGASVCAAETTPAGSTGLQHAQSGVYNVSGATTDVVCPIRRVNTSTTTGFSDFQIFVHDYSNGGLFCSLSAEDAFGNVLAHREAHSDPTNPLKLRFDVGVVNTSAVNGTYSLWCQIPGQIGSNVSAINSYYWVER